MMWKNKYYLIGILLIAGILCWFKCPIGIETVIGKWKVNHEGGVLFIEINSDNTMRVYAPDLVVNNKLEIVKVTRGEIIVKSPRPGMEYKPPKPSGATGFQPLIEEFGPRKKFKYQIQAAKLTLIDVVGKIKLDGVNCNSIPCDD